MAIKHRIEIKFVGEAPTDELARAHIIARPEVHAAMLELSRVLKEAGLEHQVTAHSVRTTDQRQNRRPRLAAAAE